MRSFIDVTAAGNNVKGTFNNTIIEEKKNKVEKAIISI